MAWVVSGERRERLTAATSLNAGFENLEDAEKTEVEAEVEMEGFGDRPRSRSWVK